MIKKNFLNKELKKITNLTIFFEFLKLGFTSFGGPIAHISFFREHFVKKRGWLDNNNFIDLVSFSNFLPGPSSSQVGMCIGYIKKGTFGALSAWLGFTLPSAIIMIISALGFFQYKEFLVGGFLDGIKAAVVIIVFQAVCTMSKQFLDNYKKIIITISTALILIFLTNNSYQIILIFIFGVIGIFIFDKNDNSMHLKKKITHLSLFYLFVFFLLLIFLPLLTKLISSDLLIIADKFFRAGSLVFGGGHVVLPILQNEILNFDILDKDTFIFGYGLAQIIPGPLFTFSGFLGASINLDYNPIFIGILSLTMIFFPSFLLVLGAMPYWNVLKKYSKIRAFLTGVNACVVGLLLSALYDPILISSISGAKSIILLILSFVILMILKMAPWLSVIIIAFIGKILDYNYINIF